MQRCKELHKSPRLVMLGIKCRGRAIYLKAFHRNSASGNCSHIEFAPENPDRRGRKFPLWSNNLAHLAGSSGPPETAPFHPTMEADSGHFRPSRQTECLNRTD